MASGSGAVLEESFVAGADLSAGQYRGVQVTSDNTVKFPTAALAAGFGGVLQDKPKAAGRGCRVVMLGRTKAMIGGTVTIGQKITCAASGWFVAQTSGYAMCGILTKTASSGYVGEVVLTGLADITATSAATGQG